MTIWSRIRIWKKNCCVSEEACSKSNDSKDISRKNNFNPTDQNELTLTKEKCQMVMSCPILIYSDALKYSEFPENIEKLIGNIFESLFYI